MPFAILKYSSELGVMVNVGVAEPEKECHVPLEAYRYGLKSVIAYFVQSAFCIHITFTFTELNIMSGNCKEDL